MHTVDATEGNGMSTKAQFSKSKVSNLFRHRGGNYYAVTKVAGKVKRRSLETDDFGLAKHRLKTALEDLRGATDAKTAGSLRSAITTEAAREDPSIKEKTRHYYQQVAKSLILTSDTLPGKPADKSITKASVADLRAWMDSYSGKASVTRYNGALALLRRTYDRAMEANQVTRNPAQGLKRLKPIQAKRDLPTIEDFAKIVEDIASQKKRSSKATAATVRFLAATGLRISEAQGLRWGDIEDKVLVVRTAKNDDIRRVPLTNSAKQVLDELRSILPTGAQDPVLPIKSPRIALENACERLGSPHLRVHDLRHIFATRCIEGGVDLPTIASWLGHKDGGVLAAKTYGHILEKHAEAQIGKVDV